MMYRFLKIIRLAISLVFLLLLSFAFIDFTSSLPIHILNGFSWIQFIPSLLKFADLLTLAGAGFILVLIITLLLGRVYCSTVCPLGILQDVFARISKIFRIRGKIYRYRKPLNFLRYGFLALAILILLAGSNLLLNLLDPFSNFGKICSDLVRPVYAFFNNKISMLLVSAKMYGILNPVDLRSVNPFTLIFPSLFLLLVAWLSLSRARVYCNTVCPVGTFLGLLSRVSLFRIGIEKSTCDRCGKCSVGCKSFCIDIKQQYVDFSRCVGCFNCLQVCPSSSIRYERRNFKILRPVKTHDAGKREFFKQGMSMAFALAALPALQEGTTVVHKSKQPSRVKEKKNYPVSPPGSISLERFNKNCTACHLCVTACPSHVIKPAMLEYGLTGFLQPRMDYHASYCNHECIVCTQVCPTGALLPLTVEQKKLNQMGKVVFVKENCIPYVDGTACGSCSEHCPTQAVKMVTFGKGTLTMPETDQEICIGCGACEEACPVRPFRAIYVDGNPIHLVAKKPKTEPVKQEKPSEDFPF